MNLIQFNIVKFEKEVVVLESIIKTIEQLEEIYQQLNLHYEYVKKQMSNIDLQMEDMLHYIEQNNFSASEGYLLAKNLKTIRQNRRQIKNEFELLQILFPLLKNDQFNVLKTKNNLYQHLNNQNNKKYFPRVLDYSTLPGYLLNK